MEKEIRIALSTDAKGHSYHATLIASILRRTNLPLHVRCWCRGFQPDSFEAGQLKVDFIPTVEEVTGKFPHQSGPAAYDRLRVIRDCADWDRCIVMDQDQLVLYDLAPLFELDFGENLLAAHMQGPGVDMAYAMRVWLKRPLPEGWEHVATHPYFLMPPLLNLKAMREAGTWEKFLAAHAAFGADEQLSLTAATEGRSLALEKKWNLFPRLHIADGELPEGVIHWSGWPKPWHKGAKVWRPDIWESEKSSWEHLKTGIWQKPSAVELEPDNDRSAKALAQRGWKVTVFAKRFESAGTGATIPSEAQFPDLQFLPPSKEAFQSLLEQKSGSLDQVRLGAWEDPADWLDDRSKTDADPLTFLLLVSGRQIQEFRGQDRGGSQGCCGDEEVKLEPWSGFSPNSAWTPLRSWGRYFKTPENLRHKACVMALAAAAQVACALLEAFMFCRSNAAREHTGS